jgi:signal transduction histidine kinase
MVANALVETGLAGRDELVDEVLGLPEPARVLGALESQATAHRLASVIHQATDRASQVVVSLHNFLRTGGDGERRWVLVADSVRAVLPLFLHRMQQGLNLTTTFQDEAAVWAWPDKLSQVWVNLINNAVQAVGAAGTIDVSVRAEDNQVVVAVADNGPGVPPEVRSRIFEAFFTTKGVGEGTGLGLEVCRRVVEELDGSITLESVPGRTVFEVRLPLAPEPS